MENQAKETTLCYIFQNDCCLLLYRNKKENDASHGKWIGIGGHVEPNETPDECAVREVFEETGLTLTDLTPCGSVQFHSDTWPDEIMYLYRASDFTGSIHDCDEGMLKWIPVKDMMTVNIWEGDRIFLQQLLDGRTDIHLALYYEGDILVRAEDLS